MADIQNFRLRHLRGRLGNLAVELTKVNFFHPAAEAWIPAVNAYRCPKGFAICVDLAGVSRDAIDIQLDGRTIRLRGTREIPEPRGKGEEPKQILAMEIDAGTFSREITLPAEVESELVRAEHKEGFLWIYLPFRCTS